MSYDEDLGHLRDACARSQKRLPLADREAAEAGATLLANGPYLDSIGKQLKTLLVSDTPTSFDVGDIRKIANTLDLEQAIRPVKTDWAGALTAIASCIPGGTDVRPPSDENWAKAIDIGRCLNALNLLPQFNSRLTSVSDAGKRLRDKGYSISVTENAYTFAEGEIERATSRIVELFWVLGSANVLTNLFQLLRKTYPVDFGLYLPGRRYAPGTGERPPSTPFGFLFNLAVKAPINGAHCAAPAALWHEAVALSIDVTAAMNLEPFSGFAFINAAPRHVESALREMALFDHLFALRQWRLSFTQTFLMEFFSLDHEEIFKTILGWTPRDAAALSRAVEYFATHDPNVITASVLRQGGMAKGLLYRMLPHFAHDLGTANVEYNSPLAADKTNLMFKPLVRVTPQHYLLPAASMLGPAFYEAVIGALRPHISSRAVSDLQGNGMERVVDALLLKSKLPVTLKVENYDLGAGSRGECDFVLEDDQHIFFVECKAKALTRGSMAGAPGDALLDFAGGGFASQVQALRHERILRERGEIKFESGARLVWADRRITRLSITLLEHGALQDRMVFAQMYPSLRGAQVSVHGSYAKKKQIADFNKILSDMTSEITQLEALGQNLQMQRLGAASISVGQLDIFLDGIKDLEHLRKRVALPVTHMTLNPLLEFHYLKKPGIAI